MTGPRHICAPPTKPLVVTLPWWPGLTTPCSCRRPVTTSEPSLLCPWHGVDALYRQAHPVSVAVGDTPALDVGQAWRCGCGRQWTVAWDCGLRRGGHTAAHAFWRPASLLERCAGRAVTAGVRA